MKSPALPAPRRLLLPALVLPALLLATPAAAPAQGAGAQGAPAARALAALRPVLEARIARHRGVVGVALLDPRTGESLSIRGDAPFPSASVIKVPILVEVFQQVEKGKLRLHDPLVLLEADKVPGAGVLQFLHAPLELTVRDAAILMIILSDNTATNLLIDKVGIRAVNARMDTLGLPQTRLHAKVFRGRTTMIDSAAYEKYGLGVTTPDDMARLLAMIYRGEAVSDDASRQMVEILKAQMKDDRIPRYLPEGTVVANKTGELNEVKHDCGIVYARARDYVLCIMTRDNADRRWVLDNEALLLGADLSRLVHEYLMATPPGRP